MDRFDNLLKHRIKKATGHINPPANGRLRLLEAANQKKSPRKRAFPSAFDLTEYQRAEGIKIPSWGLSYIFQTSVIGIHKLG
jgi:hypothetical protein